MIRVGYACMLSAPKLGNMKTCNLNNASEVRLRELIAHNLAVLEAYLQYNIHHNIQVFRISSDLIPFGSHTVNTIDWVADFAQQWQRLATLKQQHGLRLSMHPGQYSVLNSPDAGVVARTIADLTYHSKVLAALGCGQDSKLILHIGGVYGNREMAKQRFIVTALTLSDEIRKHLVLENDEKSWGIADVVEIAQQTKLPVVFDLFHHWCYTSNTQDTKLWMQRVATTWTPADGVMKLHYSQQAIGKPKGAHSQTIDLKQWSEEMDGLLEGDVDVMLEVKDKNLSALKVDAYLHATSMFPLELAWSRYKYLVLERSPQHYEEIRSILKQKDKLDVLTFYSLIDTALAQVEYAPYAINALQHVAGYFKHHASEQEKQNIGKAITAYKEKRKSLLAVKRMLFVLAQRYEQTYLLESYYFE
ncbi:MAG: UV DNA damage repair endonuclease UvsE [Erysipelotrichaceae bacterium]